MFDKSKGTFTKYVRDLEDRVFRLEQTLANDPRQRVLELEQALANEISQRALDWEQAHYAYSAMAQAHRNLAESERTVRNQHHMLFLLQQQNIELRTILASAAGPHHAMPQQRTSGETPAPIQVEQVSTPQEVSDEAVENHGYSDAENARFGSGDDESHRSESEGYAAEDQDLDSGDDAGSQDAREDHDSDSGDDAYENQDAESGEDEDLQDAEHNASESGEDEFEPEDDEHNASEIESESGGDDWEPEEDEDDESESMEEIPSMPVCHANNPENDDLFITYQPVVEQIEEISDDHVKIFPYLDMNRKDIYPATPSGSLESHQAVLSDPSITMIGPVLLDQATSVDQSQVLTEEKSTDVAWKWHDFACDQLELKHEQLSKALASEIATVVEKRNLTLATWELIFFKTIQTIEERKEQSLDKSKHTHKLCMKLTPFLEKRSNGLLTKAEKKFFGGKLAQITKEYKWKRFFHALTSLKYRLKTTVIQTELDECLTIRTRSKEQKTAASFCSVIRSIRSDQFPPTSSSCCTTLNRKSFDHEKAMGIRLLDTFGALVQLGRTHSNGRFHLECSYYSDSRELVVTQKMDLTQISACMDSQVIQNAYKKYYLSDLMTSRESNSTNAESLKVSKRINVLMKTEGFDYFPKQEIAVKTMEPGMDRYGLDSFGSPKLSVIFVKSTTAPSYICTVATYLEWLVGGHLMNKLTKLRAKTPSASISSALAFCDQVTEMLVASGHSTEAEMSDAKRALLDYTSVTDTPS